MFVVIQEIQLKKLNQYGAYREYQVCSFSASKADGEVHTWYRYKPKIESGRFDRPNKTAYKISIHKSYRENGKVKKKQCSVGTIRYYDLIVIAVAIQEITVHIVVTSQPNAVPTPRKNSLF